MKKMMQSQWSSTETCTISKALWPKYNEKSSNKLLFLNRIKLRSIITGLTGHWTLGRHGSRLNIPQNHTCIGCDEENDDVDIVHF